MTPKDKAVLRDLAKQVREISQMEKQEARRELWRKHNSLVKTRPPVLVRAYASWQEVYPDAQLKCEDPLLRGVERTLRQQIFQDSLNDDTIIEPWATVRAAYATPLGSRRWGPEIRHTPKTMKGGSWQFDPPIKKEEDLSKLVKPRHAVNEEATARNVEKITDAVGDILAVDVDRGPAYRGFIADLSTDAAQLRGLENIMWDMVERPQWLHALMRFLADGVLATHDGAEAAGDWTLTCGNNQAMTYSLDLPDPRPNSGSVKRNQLWVFMAAQEYAWVSPAMHEEFLLRYQIEIMEKFGLAAYGCCEDLTQKLDMLKQIPHLRRIAITPQADVAASAENLQRDYVLSWRPNPSLMICNGFDPARVRRIITDTMEVAGEDNIEIVLKDVQTIGCQPDNLREWTRLARDIAEKYAA